MRIDAHGWPVTEPGDPVILTIPTKRTTTLLAPAPLALVSHWTGGDYAEDRGHRDSIGLAEWIRDLPPTGENGASWNALIDKDGTLVVSASFLSGTWHVGKPGTIRGKAVLNVNRYTVGVEFENAGELVEREGRFFAWPFMTRGVLDRKYEVAAARAVAVDGRYFDAYTPAQERTAELLFAALRTRFDWPREAFTYGHVDFDSPRKIDPGPAFVPVRERILNRIYGDSTCRPI